MRRIKIFSFLIVFGFGLFVLNKMNPVAACTLGDRKCNGSLKQVCSSCYSIGTLSFYPCWKSTYCAAGCVDGKCICTSETTYGPWGSCNTSNYRQTRTVTKYVPSGCTGAKISRSCCTKSSYPDKCEDGRRYYCDSSSQKRSANCTYGCRGTVCANCNSSGGCGSGEHCESGYCVDNSVCDSSHCSNCSQSNCPSGCKWAGGVCTPDSVGGTECSSSQTKCEGGKGYNCVNGYWHYVLTCTYGCNSAGTSCGTGGATPATCSSTSCYACNESNCNSPCLWGYNGSSSMRCYSPGEAISTPTPPTYCDNGSYINTCPFMSSTHTYCESGIVRTEHCRYGCRTDSPSCAQCASDDNCGGSSVCYDQSCVNGTCNSITGGSCMYPAACDAALRPTESNPFECTGMDVCCGFKEDTIICINTSQCQESYGPCYKCINPGTIDSRCELVRTSAGSGVPGDAHDKKFPTMPTVGLCNSPYGVDLGDTTGSSGYFTWTCKGETGSGCQSDGVSANGVATKCVNQPVVNGACNSNVVGTDDDELCYRGTPIYSPNDANHDYIDDTNFTLYVWGCQGSRHNCVEEDGEDQLGCTSTINQRAWYQVNDGSILAKGIVKNDIPVTCSGSSCNPSTVKNGGVFSKKVSSLSDFDQAQKTSSEAFNFKTYTYHQLKSDYFDKKGVGTVLTGESATWAEVKTKTGVIFVDGDLEIVSDLDTTNFVMIIANGTITVDPTVNVVNGILVADKIIASEADLDTTTTVTPLVINGMVHGISGVEFSRTLLPNDSNNLTPSVKVNYNPKLLFMIPNELSKAFDKWKLN